MKYTLIICLFIVGCASSGGHTDVVIPVSQGCIVPDIPVPNYKFNTLTVDNNIWEKVQALLSDRQLSIAYEAELESALIGCK